MRWYDNGGTIPSINNFALRNDLIPYPSLAEQRQIVSFLNRKCSAIDTAIDKTKKSIEKLEEYKKAVITKAVTKGLDPDAKMKDSGVEGLGMIPDTWSVCPMKTLFSFGKGLSITKDDLTENGKPVLSYGQIHSKTNPKVSTPDELLRYVPEDKAKIQSLTSIGDFIFADTSEDRDGCGNCNYIDTEGIYAGYHTIIAKAKGITDNKYFGYLFGTDAWRFQMRRELTEVKLYSVSQKVLKNTVILLPTDSDRNRIVTFLDKKCKSIDTLISKKVETISKWEEYKKSLIYYAVTGKIDCRNEAVNVES
jgi:type I restriction enzyme S subunit